MALKDLRPRSLGPLPNWVVPTLIVLVVLSFVPLALIARARATKSGQTRIQIIPDMDQQPYFRMQSRNALFADNRAMRPEIPGTVARGHAMTDPARDRGAVGGKWVETFPVPVDLKLMHRGQERFGIYCAPCHGLSGRGDGIVAQRADRLQEGTWTPPADLHTDLVRGRTVGELYNTITNGIRNMPAYGAQIPEDDRWAIVAYVRALQRAGHAGVEDVPPEVRPSLR